MSPNIDHIDSIVIAKHILDKLGIAWDDSKISNPIFKHVLEAIRSIETIENEWSYTASTDKHTFGRKHVGETIKLWSVPRKSANVLRNLVLLTDAKNILEIGTSAGYSTLFLADGASCIGGKVVTVEILKEKADLARKFFDQSKLNNIDLIEGEARNLLKNWQRGGIDLVFLDADKENYGKYLGLLLPLMNQNGLIVADNINDYGHMMEDYLQKVTGTHLPHSRADKRVVSYYLAALDNGLMISKRL